jgi:3-phosphoshikimate 1-carboxyvinyltransferase
MGAYFNSELAPIQVTGKKLKGIKYTLPIPSAQVKSAILLAGLQAKGQTTIIEPVACRDHTERMLESFGARIRREADSIILESSPLIAAKVSVPTDISSAAFFIVAALLVPGSQVLIKNVGLNKTRTGVLIVLKQMGGNITIENERTAGNEPVGDLLVKHSELKGVHLGGDIIPTLIDEIPILAVAMTAAHGKSVVSNAEELRIKESDRIASTISMLKAFGAHVTSKEDGFIIEGDSDLIFGDVDSFGDHRIAMSGVILGLLAKGKTSVNNTSCINTSFPGFAELLISLGVDTLNDQNA